MQKGTSLHALSVHPSLSGTMLLALPKNSHHPFFPPAGARACPGLSQRGPLPPPSRRPAAGPAPGAHRTAARRQQRTPGGGLRVSHRRTLQRRPVRAHTRRASPSHHTQHTSLCGPGVAGARGHLCSPHWGACRCCGSSCCGGCYDRSCCGCCCQWWCGCGYGCGWSWEGWCGGWCGGWDMGPRVCRFCPCVHRVGGAALRGAQLAGCTQAATAG